MLLLPLLVNKPCVACRRRRKRILSHCCNPVQLCILPGISTSPTARRRRDLRALKSGRLGGRPMDSPPQQVVLHEPQCSGQELPDRSPGEGGHLGVLQKWRVLQMGREFSGIRSASLSWARQGKGFALTSAALQGCPELGIKFLLPPLRIPPSESRASGVRRALHREQCQNQLDLMTA